MLLKWNKRTRRELPVNNNVITSITLNNITSIAVHFHVHLVKVKPLRKFSGAE